MQDEDWYDRHPEVYVGAEGYDDSGLFPEPERGSIESMEETESKGNQEGRGQAQKIMGRTRSKRHAHKPKES